MNIIVSEDAKFRLKDIYQYYKIAANPKIAQKIRTNILSSIKKLAEFPELGQKDEFLAYKNLDHRRLITGNYKIIYRVLENTVMILDIFDSRQDPEKMIG